MKKIYDKITLRAIIARENAKTKVLALKDRMLLDTTGEGYVDTAIKIIIAVVIGGLLLTGLVLLFTNVIMPRVNTEVSELFDAA